MIPSISALALTLLPSPGGAGSAPRPNVLVILADDLGVDQVGVYAEGNDLPSTPQIDALATNGILFRSAYVNPLCSPSRAMLMTGRYSYDTGIGTLVLPLDAGLPAAEVTLGELVRQGTSGVATGFFGKWHLNGQAAGWPQTSNDAGWDWFEGLTGNIATHQFDSYYDFAWIENGVESQVQAYLTSHTVDRALDWIGDQNQPFFCYVAFNAPHDPYHAPPPGLHSVDLSLAGAPTVQPRPYYRAMVEAMDTEIGRLLTGLGGKLENTYVIFLADNGTAGPVVVAPFDPQKAKNTPFEGGNRVPWIVRSPAKPVPLPPPSGGGSAALGITDVSGSECEALINGTDLFRTIAELYEIDVEQQFPGLQVNSISILDYLQNPALPSKRGLAYGELFAPNHYVAGPLFQRRSVREQRFKLIRRQGFPDLYFDLLSDPFELANLLEQPVLGFQAACALAKLDAYLLSLPP